MSERRQRVTCTPREAAALDRLLDAYLATEEVDPGHSDLAQFHRRLRGIHQDHSTYSPTTAPESADKASDE